jgi:hypothetical protein
MDRKRWAQIPLDMVETIDHQDDVDGWEKLVLEPNHKDMLRSLLYSHYERAQVKEQKGSIIKDMVPEKGEGLVVLLHGILNVEI